MNSVGRRAVWLALALLVGGTACDWGGSTPKPPETPSFQGVKLTVGVIGDPALIASIQANRGEWAARTGAELVLLEKPVEPADLAKSNIDVVVFSGDRMGDLVDLKALLPLPETLVRPPAPKRDTETESDSSEEKPEPPADTLAFSDVLPAFRDEVSKYGEDRLALPLGTSALVLVYRRKAFEDPANVKAATAAGIKLEPPKTWEELDALAKFFHGRDWKGDGKPGAGIALSWGNDAEGVGNATFLARATSAGQHRDQYSLLFDSDKLGPRLDSPPFVEALQAISALKAFGPKSDAPLEIAAARKAFREMEVPLLIDRAEWASEWGKPSQGSPITTAELPGSPRVFDPARKTWETLRKPQRPAYLPHGGGWLAGVVSTSQNIKAAIDFTRYLGSPETMNKLRSEQRFPMLAIRNAQVGQSTLDPRLGVEPRPWEDAVSRTLNAERVVAGLRIPDARGYLDDLAKGRLAAYQGKPAADALAEVIRAWESRTKGLGQERQNWHYRRSLIKLSTSSEPPPKAR